MHQDDTAGDGCIDQRHASRREFRAEVLGVGRVGCAHVNDDHAGLKPVCNAVSAEHDVAHDGTGRQHGDDDARPLDDLVEGRRPRHAGRLAELCERRGLGIEGE